MTAWGLADNGHRAKRTQEAGFISALATSLSVDSLPRSGLVQTRLCDVSRMALLSDIPSQDSIAAGHL